MTLSEFRNIFSDYPDTAEIQINNQRIEIVHDVCGYPTVAVSILIPPRTGPVRWLRPGNAETKLPDAV